MQRGQKIDPYLVAWIAGEEKVRIYFKDLEIN
jgi:hypothetical protein